MAFDVVDELTKVGIGYWKLIDVEWIVIHRLPYRFENLRSYT